MLALFLKSSRTAEIVDVLPSSEAFENKALRISSALKFLLLQPKTKISTCVHYSHFYVNILPFSKAVSSVMGTITLLFFFSKNSHSSSFLNLCHCLKKKSRYCEPFPEYLLVGCHARECKKWQPVVDASYCH